MVQLDGIVLSLPPLTQCFQEDTGVLRQPVINGPACIIISIDPSQAAFIP